MRVMEAKTDDAITKHVLPRLVQHARVAEVNFASLKRLIQENQKLQRQLENALLRIEMLESRMDMADE